MLFSKLASSLHVVLLAVSRIALVKPDKARSIENMILAAAQRGALAEKVRVQLHACLRVQMYTPACT